jgi:hypothetical protein
MTNVIIMKTNGLVSEPVIYVDSINASGHMAEVYNQTVRYIREHTPITDDKEIHIKRENHSVKDEKKIGEKPDGYWFVADEKKKCLTLYKKTTIGGYLCYYPNVEKVYTMTCVDCPKVVPSIIKKNDLFTDFSKELKDRVAAFGRRTNSMKLDDTDTIKS